MIFLLNLWNVDFGLWPTVVGIVPYTAVAFCCYDFCKSLVLTAKAIAGDQSHLHNIETLACGTLAGVLSKLCTYPFDVVKKRFQVFQSTERTVIASFHSIIAHEGFLALCLPLF